MGGKQSSPQDESSHENHERLGRIKLEQKPHQPNDEEEEIQIMTVTRTVESQKAYTDWQKDFKQMDDSEIRQILLLPDHHQFESVGLCGSGGVVNLKYEYYEFVLKTEINNRYKLKKQFLETQIWYLLFNMIRAGHKFEYRKQKIGNIHPNNILINDSGQIKIISTCSLPGELNNYQELVSNPLQPVFLAPEEINQDLLQKGQYPDVDPCTAEVFSIGLTILSSGTLEDCDSLYNINPYEIKKDRLNSLLRTFKEKYSDYLYNTVASMLAINPKDRKKCSVIYKALYEYETQILDLQPFPIPNDHLPARNQSPIYQQQPMYQQNQQYRPVPQQVYQNQQFEQPQKVYQQSQQIPPYYRQNVPNNVPVYHGGYK